MGHRRRSMRHCRGGTWHCGSLPRCGRGWGASPTTVRWIGHSRDSRESKDGNRCHRGAAQVR